MMITLAYTLGLFYNMTSNKIFLQKKSFTVEMNLF